MKPWQVVFTLLLGLAAAGCRSDPSRELLERDNCDKELEIARLKNRVENLEEALNASQPAVRGQVRTLPGRELPPEPAVTLPGGPSLAPPGTNPYGEPKVELGSPAPQGENPLKPLGESPAARPVIPPLPRGTDNKSTGLNRETLPGGRGPEIAQITLHPALTGGIGTSGRTGDEGLLVVVEPRDFAGNILPEPADLKVALVDPAISGPQARLARWDFTAAQTRQMVHTGSQPGIHVRLPWKSPPAHDRLKVVVRYTTGDGRQLQVERLIGVALNAPPLTPREDRVDSPRPRADSPRPAETVARPEWSPER